MAKPEPTRNARVMRVHLLIELVARELDLARVDDDDEVTGVLVRGERRLVLAAKDTGDMARETTERLARRINNPPSAVCICVRRSC